MDADGFLTPVESSKTSQETEVGCLAFKLLITEAKLARLWKRRQCGVFTYIYINHFKTFRGMECTDSGEQCSRLWDCKTVEFWHGKGVRFGRPRAGPEARRRCTVKILRSSMNVRELWQRGNGCLQEYVIFSLRLIVQLATVQHERLQTHKFISWFSKAMSCPISLQSSVIRMVSDAGFAGCW